MEILKFSEPPKRSSRTKTQKRGGVMPLLAVAVSVAVIGGMSTTLAGTINIGSGGTVEFGQGVVTTAACDTTISIIPVSKFDTGTSTFSVSDVKFDKIGVRGGTETETAGAGCLGKYLTIRAFDVSGTALRVFAGGSGAFFAFAQIPADTATASSSGSYNSAEASSGLTISAASGFDSNPVTNSAQAQTEGTFTMSSLKIDESVTRITLESSDIKPTT